MRLLINIIYFFIFSTLFINSDKIKPKYEKKGIASNIIGIDLCIFIISRFSYIPIYSDSRVAVIITNAFVLILTGFLVFEIYEKDYKLKLLRIIFLFLVVLVISNYVIKI